MLGHLIAVGSPKESEEVKEFVAEYASELASLTFNSKPLINTLTMLASENAKAAPSLAAAIEKHVLQCSPKYKLSALYLVDSIIKNVGKPYISIFSSNLPEVFMSVWNAAPESHASLQKLLSYWKGIFPDQLLASISSQISAQQIRAAVQQQPRPAARSPRQPPSRGADQRLRFRGAAAKPRSAVMFPTVAQPAAHPRAGPPSPPASPGHRVAPLVQQPIQYPAPAPAAASAAHPVYAPVLQPYPAASHPLAQYSQTAVQQQQQPSILFPGFPQVQPPTPVQYAQPSQPLIQRPCSAGPVRTATASAPAVAPVQPTRKSDRAQPKQQQQQKADKLDECLADLAPEELPLRSVNRAKVDFKPEQLKAQDNAVIRELAACTLALRPRHLDHMFLHRRRTRGQGRKTSQQWYVRLDDWLAGTAANTQAAPAFFDIQENKAEVKKDVSVPADDSQPVCALSGERFETFWDDVTEQWCYRDAVRLDAEQAARHGLKEGQIVKVSTLSGNGDPLLGDESIAERGAQEQQVAADVGAAAAAAAAAVESLAPAVAAAEMPKSEITPPQQALPEVKQEETEQATAAPVIVPNLKREADDMPGGDAKRIKEELRKG